MKNVRTKNIFIESLKQSQDQKQKLNIQRFKDRKKKSSLFLRRKSKSGIKIDGLKSGRMPVRLPRKTKTIEDTKFTKLGELLNMVNMGDDVKASVSKKGLEDVKSLWGKTWGERSVEYWNLVQYIDKWEESRKNLVKKSVRKSVNFQEFGKSGTNYKFERS